MRTFANCGLLVNLDDSIPAARSSNVEGTDATLLSVVGANRDCSTLLRLPATEKPKFQRGASFRWY